MRKRIFAGLFVCIVGMAVIMIGCGQSGPLYLPDQQPPIHVKRPEPA